MGNDYLELMKLVLTGAAYPESCWHVIGGFRPGSNSLACKVRQWIVKELRKRNIVLVRANPYDPTVCELGKRWPCFGYSMIGMIRMNNIQKCVQTALECDIPGDLVETGVWRGGSVIFMKAILNQYSDFTRKVWVADSFEGLPAPTHSVDVKQKGFDFSKADYLAVSLETVRDNFSRLGLLDERVMFLKGWFSETLPKAPIEKIAVLRLDGDMYESTMDAMQALYPKVSRGGFVIVDDYCSWPGCRIAVDEYRQKHNITTPMTTVGAEAVWWQVQ